MARGDVQECGLGDGVFAVSRAGEVGGLVELVDGEPCAGELVSSAKGWEGTRRAFLVAVYRTMVFVRVEVVVQVSEQFQ